MTVRYLPKYRRCTLTLMNRGKFTDADLAYLSANYLTLEVLCSDRPESAAEVQGLRSGSSSEKTGSPASRRSN
jgi:hypothetical protein